MTLINIKSRWLLALLLLCFSHLTQAAEPVGKLMFAVRGVVVAHADGGTEEGVRGLPLVAGDTVKTGDKGRAQLLMADGARIALKPSTEFVIENYQAPTTASSADGSLVASSEAGSGVLSLLKGGMRAVSGEITKTNPDGLQVKTPIATMGIRGTGWKCVLVGSDQNLKLYVKVVEGLVVLQTPFGELSVNPGEIASVIEGAAPQLELQESDALSDADEAPEETEEEESEGGEETEASESSSDSGEDESAEISSSGETADSDTGTDEDAEEREDGNETDGTTTSSGSGTDETGAKSDQSSELEDTLVAEVLGVFDEEGVLDDLLEFFDEEEIVETIIEVVEELVTPVGAAGTPTATQVATALGGAFLDQLEFGENDELLEFVATFSNLNEPLEASVFSILDANNQLTAEIQNLGSDPATGFIWGRWSNGIATIDPGLSGSSESAELSGQHSVHWYHGLADLGQPLGDITASAQYSLVGNTEPTDANGNVGILGSANLSANFTQGIVDLSLQLGINNQNWSASGSGQMADAPHLSFTGNDMTGSITSGGSTVGTVTGQFVGAFSTNLVESNGVNVPAGAAIGYGLLGHLQNGTTAVSGVAVVGNPQASSGQEP
mgnify:CR=1 FL=1